MRAVLDRRITEADLDAKVSAERRREIVAAIIRVRRAGERFSDRPESDRVATAARTRAIMRADQLLRETLGYGLAEFIARESADGPHPTVARQ